MSELLPKTSLPKDLHMPAEWEAHSRCIILYPHNPQTFRLEKAQAEIDHVIQAIAKEGQERVLIGCLDQAQADMVKNKPFVDGDQISVVVCPSNDTWARDTAPTFCRDVKTHDLVGLNWDFNAYGGKDTGAYWPCDLDQQIATKICQNLNVKCVNIPLILEGGSIHTDGEGTLLVTKECLLNPNRNPHLSQDLIENILKTTLGVSVVIWLPKGLDADEDTNGHIDNFCCFVKPGHVVLAWTDDENDRVNYKRCRVASLQLKSSKDAKGRTIQVHKLHLPPPLSYTKEEAESIGGDDKEYVSRQAGTKMAASYVNFYIANKAVIVSQFGVEESDKAAVTRLQHLFPDRKIVGVPSREILLGGGNIHCQTQQFPGQYGEGFS